MLDENWLQVRDIFDAALHRKPEERRAFVIEACGGDAELLSEVESLLRSLDSAESFMEVPAVATVADAFAGKKLEKGQLLGHYRIIKEIGSGGMGEVYLAKDQILDRHVAVKILNEEFSGDESNLTRFIHEAQAASALSHPNILVIHEIGASAEAHFIVSEYVEGETLRTICQDNALKLSEILDISIQIAGALSVAHKAHLIHRDIKPENIMLRPDGYVKILDFGLAKLIEEKNRSFLGIEEKTLRQNQTAKGLILGTVNYMSPEQAKGEDVDERTDIFSFGVLMYEMIAGRTPFGGDSMSETFANLITTEPQPLSSLVDKLPDELPRIVSKMLRKNRDERFQTMKGLLAELKNLKENLTIDEKLERAGSPGALDTEGLRATTGEANRSTGETLYSISRQIERHKPLAAVALIVLLIGALTGFFVVKFWQTETPGTATGQVSQKRLTVAGGATRVAISRDGKYAAAAQNAALILFDLQNGGELTLVPAAKDIRIMTIAFHPGGGQVYYATRQVESTFVSIFRMSLAGGEPTKVLDEIYGSLSFSPDGTKFAFVRRYPELNEFALLTADADGSNINKLATSRLPNPFDGTPAWSPDGKTIACSAINVEGGFHFTVAKVDVATGAVENVPEQRWKSIGGVSWLADSARIIIAGQDESSVNTQVWLLDALTGSTRRITDDLYVYESLSGTPDGRSIVTVKVRQTSHVWMFGETQTQLTAGFDNHDGFNGLSWSGDGTIFYHSRANDRDAIWRMKVDGTEVKEITPDAGGGFAVSPDGRFLVFQGKQSADQLGLQLMNLSDGSLRQLTEGMTALSPAFYPDGKKIAFMAYDKKLTIHEISINGGPSEVLSGEFRAAMSPVVSPSGKYIAFALNRVQTGNIEARIGILDSKTRQLVVSHRVKIPTGSQYEKPTLQWSADESEVYFIQLDNSVSNIMRLKLSDGTVSNVTNFTDGRIFNFEVEPGGTRILIARGLVERDATLIKIDGPF